MKIKYLAIIASLFVNLLVSPSILAEENVTCHTLSEQQVKELFTRWNDSLQTKDADKVVANYADNAVLLATLANKPLINHEQIKGYFVDFLKKNPQGIIEQSITRGGCNWASDSGLYLFKLKENGKPGSVEARYSFVYEYINGKWLIVQHHSSQLPLKATS